MKKVALITGITGQDGSYLAEFLLEKGYDVHGIIRRTSYFNTSRIDAMGENAKLRGQTLKLHYGDLMDQTSLFQIIRDSDPDEIYNLAAQTHVKVSFENPEVTSNVNALGLLRLMEAILLIDNGIKLYQASTSEMFGKVQEVPQREETPFYPRSPYGVSKLYAYWLAKNYREAYNLHVSNGILFNHESPRRGETFVTRKITLGLANLRAGIGGPIVLGNLDAKRDWGYTPDYVKCMWMMLQQKESDDYVIATGKMHTVREFAERAAAYHGREITWSKDGKIERGHDQDGNMLFRTDPSYLRPTEVDQLCGNPLKAQMILGWQPETKFDDLVRIMAEADWKVIKDVPRL